MSQRFRKALAAFLCVWLLVLSTGYAPAFAAELQHDLESIELAVEGPVPAEEATCSHGCAGHLSAHLFTVEGCATALVAVASGATSFEALYPTGYSVSSALFLPPKVLPA